MKKFVCFVGTKVRNKAEVEKQVYRCIERLYFEDGEKKFLLYKDNDFTRLVLCQLRKFKQVHDDIDFGFFARERECDDEILHPEYYLASFFPQCPKACDEKLEGTDNIRTLIFSSDYCIFYIGEEIKPVFKIVKGFPYLYKSGIELAYDFAMKNCKKIIKIKNHG